MITTVKIRFSIEVDNELLIDHQNHQIEQDNANSFQWNFN